MSQEIGDYYAQKRKIPSRQILRVSMPTDEEIQRSVYVSQIEKPIYDWLSAENAQDRILYIVLTKGVPLRIAGSTGDNATISSVDSELTLLYRKTAGDSVPIAGAIRNPYYLGDQPVASAKPFSHRDHDIYLVARLDGYTVADVRALIDRGSVSSRPSGAVLLRTRGDRAGTQGDEWLSTAAKRVAEIAGREEAALLWRSVRGVPDSNVLGYYGWGSNDPILANSPDPKIRFAAGAIGGTFVSTDARTFRPPPEGWHPGQQFGGSVQSMVGTLVHDGITGVSGHVAEPLLTGTVRPDILFPVYLRGLNLVEAFYAAMPLLSWQNVVIGDPLCAPFRRTSLPRDDLDPPVDSISELPRFLADRRVASFKTENIDPDALRWYVKAERRMAKKDPEGSRKALQESVRIAPRFAQARLLLGTMSEQQGDFTTAVAHYRRVLELEPNNVPAMNNLAYNLAVRLNNLDEGLALAQRALFLAQNSPDVTDTLAWIHYLKGDTKIAEALLGRAAKLAPNNVELVVHLAIVLARNGKAADAKATVDHALKLDPNIRTRDDVRALLERLAKSGN